MNKIKITKLENKYIFNLNGFDIHFCRVINEEIKANLWNIIGIFKGDTVVCPPGTDIIGVIHEKGEADFMGGVHGDETLVDFHILADGKNYDESISECSRLDIIMHSHLTRVSTGENVIDRMVYMELCDNSITITTAFECLVDNFSMQIAYNGGMFAWVDELAEFQYTNAGPIISGKGREPIQLDSERGIVSAVCKIPDAFITVENLVGHENASYNGKAFYYGKDARPRVKIYFSTDRENVWNKGHVCTGKARYTLI